MLINRCINRLILNRLILNRSILNRSNFIRGLSTVPVANNEQSIDSEWNSAQPFEKIPGPSILKLITRFMPGGQYHDLPLVQVQKKLCNEYGPLVKFPGTFGRRDLLFAFDPNDFEKIYRTEGIWPLRRGLDTFAYYRKEVRPELFKNMGGLISEQGESWATLRSKVNPVMLQPKTVKNYIPQVDAVACEFLESAKTSRDVNNELPADFGNDMNKWALESIGVIALDQRLGVLVEDNPDAKLLIKSVREFFRLSYELDVQPSAWKYISTPKFKRLMEVFDDLTNLVLKYVDNRITELDKNNLNRETSVLEKLLKIDRHAAVVMAMDMLLAGVDTTSASSIGLFYHLAKNPDKQEKLREEVRSLLPNPDSKLTPESLNTIPYLRACLKESMRLSPIVPGNGRGSGQNIVMQGYQVPKGVDIVISNVPLQQNDTHFPDSDKFLPERWLKDQTKAEGCPSARSAHPFIFLPFGFGPRSCIGRRFAEMEIEILTMRTVKQFHIEWNYPPIKYMTSLILTPISDLKFKLTEIKE